MFPLMRIFHFLSVALGFFLVAVPMGPAAAAGTVQLAERAGTDGPTFDRPRQVPPDYLVMRLQKALSMNGLYFGPVDGYMNPDMKKAISRYQKKSGLKVDARVTEALIEKLETGVKVGLLLKRLESARSDNIKAARAALMSRPETRELLIRKESEIADPTRDPSSCFASPTARCLLDEAVASTKAISRPEMRDWALGEVLVAQARAGFSKSAITTVSRINDPRLIMVALRDIALAQAGAGRDDEALAAVEIIPDIGKQLEAYAQIAAIQAKRGDADNVKGTVSKLIAVLKKEKRNIKRIAFRSRVAVIMEQVGDGKAARYNLDLAETLARSSDSDKEGLRIVATALARMGQPKRALSVLKEAGGDIVGTSVLVSAAKAQVRAGDDAGALATTENIEAMRYRAVVLSQIATAQASKGTPAGRRMANQTIDKALVAAESIKPAFAHDFALGRIAMAMAGINLPGESFDRSLKTAGKIKDDRLRAHILWAISAVQRHVGDTEGAKKTEDMAKTATALIKSSLSKIWMFSEIALSYAEEGYTSSAWAAFWRAMPIAETIRNSWARARALSKLASTMIELGGKAK